MKIVSFDQGSGAPRVGAYLTASEEVLDFAHPETGLAVPDDVYGWYDLDGSALAGARRLVSQLDEATTGRLRNAGALVKRGEIRLCAPVARPRKVLCIGLNYRDHAEESGLPVPEVPLVFSKFPNCVVGPGDAVILPPTSKEVDYEAELGVVIGRRATRVDKGDALDHVLGYVNVNDVSARDFQFADGQWQRGKSCDTFCPMGEYIATTEEIQDPHSLSIKLHLNGETLQDSSTNQLIFRIPELVSYLSSFITLEPGDLIATGTPPGVGFARKPPVYIKNGDVMEVEIEGLGTLSNPVKA